MSRTIFTQNSDFDEEEFVLNKIRNLKQIAVFSCDVVRSVIPIWQKNVPEDKYVLRFIQIIEDYNFGLIDVDYVSNNRIVPLLNRFGNFYEIYHALDSSYFASIGVSRENVVSCAIFTTSHACVATNHDKNQWDFVYQLYLQTFKPKHIAIPKLPLFLEIANEIKDTRNFSLYNILVDAVYDYCNIKVKAKCLGLSNWLLFDLFKNNKIHAKKYFYG